VANIPDITVQELLDRRAEPDQTPLRAGPILIISKGDDGDFDF
jgi:hypothetical protein